MKIRLDFCDFWPGFQKTNNFFYNLLRERFDVEICDQPDDNQPNEFFGRERLLNQDENFPDVAISGRQGRPENSVLFIPKLQHLLACPTPASASVRLPSEGIVSFERANPAGEWNRP